MNTNTFYQALSKFRGFAENVPKSLEIQPVNLQIYDELLTDIAGEIGQNMDYFRIRNDHHTSEDVGDYDDWGEWQKSGTKLVCERSVFLTHLNGAIAFINTLIQSDKPGAIGFIK